MCVMRRHWTSSLQTKQCNKLKGEGVTAVRDLGLKILLLYFVTSHLVTGPTRKKYTLP